MSGWSCYSAMLRSWTKKPGDQRDQIEDLRRPTRSTLTEGDRLLPPFLSSPPTFLSSNHTPFLSTHPLFPSWAMDWDVRTNGSL